MAIASIKSKVRKQIVSLIREAVFDMLPLIPQMIEYHNSAAQERQFYHDHTRDPFSNVDFYAGLRDRLSAAGVPVQDVQIDIADFERWLDALPKMRATYEKWTGDASIEKCLEHYLVLRQLKISDQDVYIDIGAAGSPWADILNKKGIRSYRLDLAYPSGIHGSNIGADAGDTKLPDRFASVLSLQCAYEHFMGDADVWFVKEAARILKEKGRYGILPLYLADTHFNLSSPYCCQQDVVIDAGARRVWREGRHREPFGRFYSPESFQERVYANIPESMHGKVLYFSNLTDVMNHYPGQRIYCFFMFYCEKLGPESRLQ